MQKAVRLEFIQQNAIEILVNQIKPGQNRRAHRNNGTRTETTAKYVGTAVYSKGEYSIS